MQISYTSREQVDIYRFNWPIAIFVPLAAITLQAFLPVKFHFFRIFDLPLLITIFFAVSRRNPISGLITGALIGLTQDALTNNHIGMYGISKTVVGYAASSLGVKIDVDNPGSRLLITFGFYVMHEFIYFAIAKGLVKSDVSWYWPHELGAGFANALLAVVLFHFLDRLKQKI